MHFYFRNYYREADTRPPFSQTFFQLIFSAGQRAVIETKMDDNFIMGIQWL